MNSMYQIPILCAFKRIRNLSSRSLSNKRKEIMKNTTIASLQECEIIIEQGLQTFIQVGRALLTIKEQKLYRATHSNFNEYCKERWGFTQQHAGRLVIASKVADIIESEPIGLHLPQSESQTRILAKSDNPVETWKEAIERSGKEQPTASEIQNIIQMNEKPIKVKYPNRYKEKAVKQILLSGETYTFESIGKASRATQTHASNIWKACRGKRVLAGGFKWEYIN